MASMLDGALDYRTDNRVTSGKMSRSWAKYIIDYEIKNLKLESVSVSGKKYFLLKDPNVTESQEDNVIDLPGAGPRNNVEILDDNLIKVGRSYFAKVRILRNIGYININRLRKPTQSSLGKAHYGKTFLKTIFSDNDLKKEYDTSGFRNICNPLVGKKLPEEIKEASDVEIVKMFNDLFSDDEIIDIKIGNKTYKNIIGCVPIIVDGSEPKADICLVSLEKKKLIPVAFISYKKSNFRTYGGYTQAGSEGMKFDKDAKKIFKERNYKGNFFRKVENDDIKKQILYGKKYKNSEGIESCDHIIRADKISLSGNILTVTNGKIYNKGDIPTGDFSLYFKFYGSDRQRSVVATYEHAIQGKSEEI
jgi:hypothetical protein